MTDEGAKRSKPVALDSKWVSSDDFEWAESVGIFIYPKGFTSETGTTILHPKLARMLEANLPTDTRLTAQDVSMEILNALIKLWPDLEPKDLIRAFGVLSTRIGLHIFPQLLRPFVYAYHAGDIQVRGGFVTDVPQESQEVKRLRARVYKVLSDHEYNSPKPKSKSTGKTRPLGSQTIKNPLVRRVGT